MSQRPTVRPVTLARLIEVTHACSEGTRTTADVEAALEVSHRRARETILEAVRIGLIRELDADPEDADRSYETTQVGAEFLRAVNDENWMGVSDILETRSPHYKAILGSLETVGPADLETVLEELSAAEEFTDRSYNQTSVEVLGDWGERLGRIQRNAFTGTFYLVQNEEVPKNFAFLLLSIFDDLEETAGLSLRQRYLSIPELREHFCERAGCPRALFDAALEALAKQNVGKVELSGAPIDTGAKDAQLGIKSMSLAESGGLVSTTQSTEQVMQGVEQFGKQYYYLAVHDRDLTFNPEYHD